MLPTALDGTTVAAKVTAVPWSADEPGVTTSVVVVVVAGAFCTTYDTTVELDAANAVASAGMKVALSECVAIDSADVVNVAVPPTSTGEWPSCVAPSRKVTDPAAAAGVTDA